MVERIPLANGIVGYRMGLGKRPFMVSWCYRLGHTLIDVGPPNTTREFLPVLLEDGPIRHIFISHHHEDHSGGAAAIRSKTGAEITLSSLSAPLTRVGFHQPPYQRVYWGRFRGFEEDELLALAPLGSRSWSTPDGDFKVIHAPGHSHDMAVVWDEARSALFSADLYLASRLTVMRRDEVWPVLEQSLARVLESTSFEMLLCGHRPVFEGGHAALLRKYTWMQTVRTRIEQHRSASEPPQNAIGELGRGDPLFRMFTLGDMSRLNMFRSLTGKSRPRTDVVKIVGEAWAGCDFS